MIGRSLLRPLIFVNQFASNISVWKAQLRRHLWIKWLQINNKITGYTGTKGSLILAELIFHYYYWWHVIRGQSVIGRLLRNGLGTKKSNENTANCLTYDGITSNTVYTKKITRSYHCHWLIYIVYFILKGEHVSSKFTSWTQSYLNW